MLFKTIPCAFLLLTACMQGEADTALPNGYRFVELSKGNGAIITGAGDFAVYPNVVEYRLRGAQVVGKRELAEDNADHSNEFTEGLGYFVLDTSTGELRQGLSLAEVK